MSGMKRAADAAPRFQERLKTQITRSTAVLLTAFLLLFGVLLAIYSEGYTYYENREYNRQLTEAFRDTYLSCADYLRSGDNMAVMESFLTGEITELNMSYQFHRFTGAGKTRFTRDGQQYMVSAGQPAVGGLVVYTLLQRGHWGTYYIIGCLCAVLMFGVLFFTLLRVSREIASRNSRSVETLHDELSIIQQGNVDHKIRLDTGDEFQEIAAHINSMLDTINELNRRNMELAKLNNSAEIAQLESRFHPHFLYNTLENIRYAILLGEPERADEMIRRLTALLRYSTDTSRSMVTLGSDTEKLRDYLEIIRFRQNGQFSYRIEIAGGVEDVLIPKLWIQPVVENSVKYGFLRKQALHVDLTARMEDGFLLIVVTDNGTGFEPQRLEEVRRSLTAPQKDVRQSGLQSIARRLALLYGEESTITVESEYMVYTRVTLRMKRGEH